MNTRILRTSLAALLAASFGLAQAQATTAADTGKAMSSSPQAASSDQVIPGKDEPAHKMTKKEKHMKKAKSDKMEPAGADMSADGKSAKTGPNATGSAGSGKTP